MLRTLVVNSFEDAFHGMLRDRNTVKMVADHWGCSTDTVRRLIKSGSLPCLQIGGVVRLSREQVETYETQCT
ncbi:MAG: excisionase family DNA-binding protein, partial [Alphaproteobacteria bacterium]|nr:excisionase family DNA-binding protein [Alphaproteobacteria bacterium]